MQHIKGVSRDGSQGVSGVGAARTLWLPLAVHRTIHSKYVGSQTPGATEAATFGHLSMPLFRKAAVDRTRLKMPVDNRLRSGQLLSVLDLIIGSLNEIVAETPGLLVNGDWVCLNIDSRTSWPTKPQSFVFEGCGSVGHANHDGPLFGPSH